MDYDLSPGDHSGPEDVRDGVLRTQENRSARTLFDNLQLDRDSRRATQSRPSAADQQFARFLEAADRLGEHLETNLRETIRKTSGRAYGGNVYRAEKHRSWDGKSPAEGGLKFAGTPHQDGEAYEARTRFKRHHKKKARRLGRG